MSEQVDVAAVGRAADRVADWVVVIEAKPERAGDCLDFGLVQGELQWLREWRPSCLYNPRQYTIQLHIAAITPAEALRNAVAYHDEAVQAVQAVPTVGRAKVSLTRAEVLTLGEFEEGRDSGAGVAGSELAGLAALAALPGVSEEAEVREALGDGWASSAPRSRHALISDLLYRTTRALLQVSTPADIIDLLVGFVTGVGGSISVGDGYPVGRMVTVALSGHEPAPLYGVAEAMSAAGLIIERYLPSLVEDAGRVRRQLH